MSWLDSFLKWRNINLCLPGPTPSGDWFYDGSRRLVVLCLKSYLYQLFSERVKNSKIFIYIACSCLLCLQLYLLRYWAITRNLEPLQEILINSRILILIKKPIFVYDCPDVLVGLVASGHVLRWSLFSEELLCRTFRSAQCSMTAHRCATHV